MREAGKAARFAEGNKLASTLYRHLEKDKRQYKLFCFLKKRAILLLKQGKSLADAEAILKEYLIEFGCIEDVLHEPKTQKKQQDFSIYNFSLESCLITDLQTGQTVLLKTETKTYACAVGPPKVIGI